MILLDTPSLNPKLAGMLYKARMNDSNRYRTQRGPIRAARGTELTARSWLTEAPLRMLMNLSLIHISEPTRPY